MSVKGSAASLNQALKELSVAWDQTKTYWRDAKSREFEKRYLHDLPGHLARATEVMDEIDSLLRKVRNDCE